MKPATVTRVKNTFDKWNNTQAYLKEAELITEAAPVAAINELRYAGRMFSAAALKARGLDDVFSLQSEADLKGKTFEEAMLLTNQYIDNANHDVSDTLIYFYNSILNSLAARYGENNLSAKYPKISQAFTIIKTARSLVVESRGNISLREKNYIKVRELMVDMKAIYPEIRNIEIVQDISHEHDQNRSTILTSAIVGVLVGAAVSALIIYILF